MYRPHEADLNYMLYPTLDYDKFNNTAHIGWIHNYKYKNGTGNIELKLSNSTIGSQYDFSKIVMTSVQKNKLGKFQLNTRLFGQYGTGSNWAQESKLLLSGANSEELMENKFTRSKGFIPNEWLGYGASTNHFQMGGGLNLRGYAGYLAPEIVNQSNQNMYVNTFQGESGASISAELEIQNILPIINKHKSIASYLFADAGIINVAEFNSKNIRQSFSSLRADAGIGFTYTFNKWKPLQMVKPLILRIDFPFFLNRYPSIDEGSFQTNRFVVGIGRTF